MSVSPRSRRRSVRSEPGREAIDGREVWVLQVEQPLGHDVSVVAEFVSVDGTDPIRRSIQIVSDFLVPDVDIDSDTLAKVKLLKLGREARDQLQEFLSRHPEWADAVAALTNSGIPRRSGRPSTPAEVKIAALRPYAKAYESASKKRPPKTTIYMQMRTLMEFRSESAGQIEADVAHMKRQVKRCRADGLLPKGRPGRPPSHQ